MEGNARMPRPLVAVNPLQVYADGRGWFDFCAGPPAADIVAAVAEAGFRAVQPFDHHRDPGGFAALVGSFGLVVGPGYLSIDDTSDEAAVRAQAAAEACDLAALGVDTAFVGFDTGPTSPRWARPARGAPLGAGRWERGMQLLEIVVGELGERGITAALHPHVASLVETEDETRAALDATMMGFGPDVGHLAWAHADLHRILADYRQRIVGVHIKDVALAARDAAPADYATTVARGLWREPGDGDLPLGALIDAVPSRAWLVIEVDASALPWRESLRRSALGAARLGLA
jgi:inosose dehydratase